MNKRIKELAEQAGFSTELSEAMTTRHNTASGLEKFAELIVRECLNQCYNRGMNDELYAGQLKAAAYIEQHFEVEE
jgi:hypothetical protein